MLGRVELGLSQGARLDADVLLDDEPALVPRVAQDAQERGHVDRSRPDRREDVLAHRGGEVQPRRKRALVAIPIDIFQVHVPDARGLATSEGDRIAAAVEDMTGIEAEADQRWISLA